VRYRIHAPAPTIYSNPQNLFQFCFTLADEASDSNVAVTLRLLQTMVEYDFARILGRNAWKEKLGGIIGRLESGKIMMRHDLRRRGK
jgi:hypothetical protein